MNHKLNIKPKWRRRKENRVAEIRQSALRLFSERGYNSTTMSQLAKAAGVTPGTIYLYYKNKEEIMEAVFADAIEPIVSFAIKALESFDGNATDAFSEIIYYWNKMIYQSEVCNLIIKLVYAEAHNFPNIAKKYIEHVIRPSRELFRKFLQLGIDNGELEISNIDYTITLLMAPLQYASIHKCSLAQFDDDRKDKNIGNFQHHGIEIFLNGLKKR